MGGYEERWEATPVLDWWDVGNSASSPAPWDHVLSKDVDDDVLPEYAPCGNVSGVQRKVQKCKHKLDHVLHVCTLGSDFGRRFFGCHYEVNFVPS